MRIGSKPRGPSVSGFSIPVPPSNAVPPEIAEARWDATQRAWIVRVPSSGWTRLNDVLREDESDAGLLVSIGRQFGARQARGLRVVKVAAVGNGTPTPAQEGG